MKKGDVAELYCTEVNQESTFLTNTIKDTLADYSYTMVESGK